MTIPKLLLEVQNRRSDIIQLTSDLIKIPTINPPGTNYREICEFLSKRLKVLKAYFHRAHFLKAA